MNVQNALFNNPIGQRDYQYLRVLTEYNTHQHKSNQMRRIQQWIFFGVITAILILVVVVSGIIVFHIVGRDINLESLGVVVSVITAMIGSIIVLPKIIATHLFPPQGNKIEVELVKVISDYDLKNVNEAIDEDMCEEV